MNERIIVVSASNSVYYELYCDLLGTLKKSLGRAEVSIGLIDIGLTVDQRADIEKQGVLIKHIPIHFHVASNSCIAFKSQFAKPKLPDCFEGFDYYVWLDADVWIQNGNPVLDLVEAASVRDVACVMEVCRNYPPMLMDFESIMDGQYPSMGAPYIWSSISDFIKGLYEFFYDVKLARHFMHFPHVNSGVFCAKANSPIWKEWQKYLEISLQKRGSDFGANVEKDFLCEQVAFHRAVHTGEMTVNFLPTVYNWCCHARVPILDGDDILCEPNFPYSPIKIVHLSYKSKGSFVKIYDLANKITVRSFRYQSKPPIVIRN